MEADRLYLKDSSLSLKNSTGRSKLLCKKAATRQLRTILDPAQLSPAGKVYWREAEAGRTLKIQTRVLVPLRLLVEYPEFVPGHLRLAQALAYDHPKEALEVLEQATTLYPAQPDLVKAKVAALADAKNGWKHLWRVNLP